MSDRADPPIGADRASFMARVRAALGHAAAPAELALAIDEGVIRTALASDDPAAQFTERAREVGMTVHAATGRDAGPRVADILTLAGSKRVSVDDDVPLAGLGAFLASKGLELARRAPGMAHLFDCDAGITGVRAAVAETGSLVCVSAPGAARATSLVPPLHVAIVRQSDILLDLVDLLRLDTRRIGLVHCSSLVLITGPSKTADIEGVLITGVHGPREVHIVLIHDA